MDPTNIEAPVLLSRIASGTIPFARAVERSGSGTIGLFGGTMIDDAQAAWTSGHANVTVSTPAGAFATLMNHFACAAVTDATNIAYKVMAPTDMSAEAAFGILIKSTIAQAAGDIQAGADETAAFASPQLVDVPAMEAAKWYYFNLAFGGVVGDRDAVVGFGLYNNSGGAMTADIDVQWIGRGALIYDIAGFANADIAVEDDEAVQYRDVLVLAAGRITGLPLATGVTCLAEQQLYPVPGTGKLSTTEIAFGVRPITAAEDQANAGGNVMVVR